MGNRSNDMFKTGLMGDFIVNYGEKQYSFLSLIVFTSFSHGVAQQVQGSKKNPIIN